MVVVFEAVQDVASCERGVASLRHERVRIFLIVLSEMREFGFSKINPAGSTAATTAGSHVQRKNRDALAVC